jgi:preprotein translocase subunit Sss1
MAIWEVRVVYQNGDRFWENVWNVDIGEATDVPPALVSAFVTFARNCLLDLYSVARVARRPAGSHDEFIETVVGLAGLLAVGSGKALPLFNVVKLVLQVGAGRPGIKLLRGLLSNAHLLDEQNHIIPSLITLVDGNANDLFNAASAAACTFVVGESNKPAVSPVVDQSVEMRQLHRKRKKTV